MIFYSNLKIDTNRERPSYLASVTAESIMINS